MPSTEAQAPPGSLKNSAAAGMLWQGSSYLFGKTSVMVTTLVLAHLLVPEQFGLVALATVFVTYADSISDLGVAQALVYLPRTAGTARGALVSATATGLLISSSAFLGAPLVAAVFHEPDVTPLVRLLCVSLLTGALASVPEALMRRELHFRRLSAAAVLRSVVLGVVSITLAATGAGAAALVVGTVAGAVTYAIAIWVMLPDRPDGRIWLVRRRDVAEVLSFGLPAAGGLLLAKLISDVDYLIVGRALGTEALGLYTMAFRVPELLIINMFFVVSSVTFPLYSRARDDGDRLRRGYLASVRVQAAYGVCAGLGLAATAPVLVPVVLGSHWMAAVPALIPLALYAALRSLGAGANDIYKAVGRPGLTMGVSVVRLLLLVPALLLATRWGFTGVAWAQAAAAAVFVLLMQGVALRVLHLTPAALLRATCPAAVAGTGTLLVATGVVRLLPGSDPVVLGVAVLLGAMTGAAALQLAAPSLGRDLLRAVRYRARAL